MPDKEKHFTPIDFRNHIRIKPEKIIDTAGRLTSENALKNADSCETVTYPCPYFNDGRMTTLNVIKPSLEQILGFHELLALGFRRSGSIFYLNSCQECKDCISIRIPIRTFSPSKSQRRTLRQNSDIQVVISHFSERSETETQKKFDLFQKYMIGKHGNKENAQWMEFYSLHHGYPFTTEIHYYLKDRLIGVSVIDEGKNAISSNYFYYDPDLLDRRLGIFSILKEIEYAESQGKEFYYLGFYIENCQKMAYKKNIRPNEILSSGKWTSFLA